MLRIARKKAFEMECGFHWLSSHRPNTIIKIGIRIGPKKSDTLLLLTNKIL